MNERLYILSIDGNRKKLYKTCMRSGFRSVYILLLACTTSTKQQPHENYFWILSITLDFFLQLQWCLEAILEKYGAIPTLKRNFYRVYFYSKYLIFNLEYLYPYFLTKIFLNSFNKQFVVIGNKNILITYFHCKFYSNIAHYMYLYVGLSHI